MALEKAWGLVSPQPFTADGTTLGQITIANTAGFKTKQVAYLLADGLDALPVQIKRVLSPTTLVVGTINNAQIASWKPLDISAFTVALNAAIGAQEQPKNEPTVDDIFKAVYESDPTVALRVIFTDQYGNLYSDQNPLPATFTGSISIGAVEVKGTNGNYIEPNSDGSINVVIEPSAGIEVVNTYNELVAVAANSTVSLVTYTVPAGMTGMLQRVTFSGENIARYDVYINGNPQDTARTMFGGDLTGSFDFTTGTDSGGLPLNSGDVVLLKVYNIRPSAATFEGRIQVLQVS